MSTYNVGNIPPQIVWTIVRGDSAIFKVFVTDDEKQALDLSTWTIDLEIRRGLSLIVALEPAPVDTDETGYFTVKLLPEQSEILQTDDIFDIQLFDGGDTVWTVAQGAIVVVEDVTGAPSGNS
jgi:hypothetical protein